jgi:hypothetical protein
MLTILIAFVASAKSFSQNKNSIDLIGQWAVCISLKKTNTCGKAYVIYEFYSNGTFKDSRKEIGKWEYKDDILIIDYDDKDNSNSPPRAYNIIFMNKNRFYEVGKEGEDGPDVYTYFQRLN